MQDHEIAGYTGAGAGGLALFFNWLTGRSRRADQLETEQVTQLRVEVAGLRKALTRHRNLLAEQAERITRLETAAEIAGTLPARTPKETAHADDE